MKLNKREKHRAELLKKEYKHNKILRETRKTLRELDRKLWK